jgi:hypothetical protein
MSGVMLHSPINANTRYDIEEWLTKILSRGIFIVVLSSIELENVTQALQGKSVKRIYTSLRKDRD